MSGSHADTTADMSTYHHLVDVGLPLVLVNGYSPTIATPQISDDDVSAMDQAIAHLVSLGHEHIGLAVGPRRYVPAQRKEQGVRAAMDRPPLTSLHQDVGLISTMAVQSLIGLVRGDAVFLRERLVRPELVIRATTGPARGA